MDEEQKEPETSIEQPETPPAADGEEEPVDVKLETDDTPGEAADTGEPAVEESAEADAQSDVEVDKSESPADAEDAVDAKDVEESTATVDKAKKKGKKKKAEKPEQAVSAKEEEERRFPGIKPLVFGRWDTTEVVVHDPSVRQYINLQPVVIPHTSARKGRKRLTKSDVSIVERLINNVMRNEKNTGAKQRAYFVVQKAFELIEKRTQRNPIQVLTEAITNTGPREETVRLRYGGINVPKAVDTSPQRRVDSALMFIARGTERASFKSRKSVSQCLAEEIIAASEADTKCFSVGRKDEKERVAKAAR